MGSSAAALKEALLITVCVLLLHSSTGHKPPRPPPPPPVPASQHCHYTGQKPPPPPVPAASPPPPSPPLVVASPPPPSPVPSLPPQTLPAPAPAPAPGPASTNCNQSDCAMQCGPFCEANRVAGNQKCDSDYYANGKACYASCTSSLCHGSGSSVYSGCGGYCPCDSANATMCSQSCGSALYSEYSRCRNFNDRYVEYCMIHCRDSCYKNCTLQA